LLFIPVRVIIVSPVGEDVQPLCQWGRIIPVSVGYLAFACPVRRRRVVSAAKTVFSCGLSGKTVIYSFFKRVCAGTCSCVRIQVLVSNANKWETGS